MENTEKVVYLDNAATTACAPEALAVMVEALNGACGNPSSHYSVGYEAKEFVDKGRAQVAKAINASTSEIFFTGCGSEADNWAVKGTAFTKARQNKKHLITSAFEHHAIMHSMAALERLGFEVTYIKPTTEGYIRPEDVEAAIRPDTALISIMMANNEIGTIQPIKEIAEIAHKHGVWMHTDAVQAVGAIPVDVKELGRGYAVHERSQVQRPQGHGRAVLTARASGPRTSSTAAARKHATAPVRRTSPASPAWARPSRWRPSIWKSAWPTRRSCVTTSSTAS